MVWCKGVARGVLGCPWPPPPLCKPFFLKQTTYNILWRKRHDENVWHSVTPPPFEKSWLRPCDVHDFRELIKRFYIYMRGGGGEEEGVLQRDIPITVTQKKGGKFLTFGSVLFNITFIWSINQWELTNFQPGNDRKKLIEWSNGNETSFVWIICKINRPKLVGKTQNSCVKKNFTC